MFQVPGTHHFLRPEVKLEAGHLKELARRTNEFYYAESAGKGLVVFRGEEPQLNVEGYADAFFDAVEALGVRRVMALGGVYGSVPYDRDRQVACVYSLPRLKEELEPYALTFSDYEGGASIGTYLADEAERRGIELIGWYAFVPAYDYSPLPNQFQGVRIENDARAWYEVMRRVNYMFGLAVDLSDLRQRSEELVEAMHDKIKELERELSQYDVKKYMAKVYQDFARRRSWRWTRCGSENWATSSAKPADCWLLATGAAILKQQLDALVEFHRVFGAHIENAPTVDLPTRSSPCA